MNLIELERQKSELLAELATETECAYISRIASENEKHVKICQACTRKRQIGKAYEKVQKQIKKLKGRSNTPSNDFKVKISTHTRQLAKRNGINRHTLYRRIKNGMPPRQAATKPLKK